MAGKQTIALSILAPNSHRNTRKDDTQHSRVVFFHSAPVSDGLSHTDGVLASFLSKSDHQQENASALKYMWGATAQSNRQGDHP
jgi:hypothetical protein